MDATRSLVYAGLSLACFGAVSPASALERQSFVMKSVPPANQAPAESTPQLLAVPVRVSSDPRGHAVGARNERDSARYDRRRIWRRDRRFREKENEPESSEVNFLPFHSPNIAAPDAPTDAKDAVAEPSATQPVRRFVSDDGTRTVLVSGGAARAQLYDTSGSGDPELIKDLDAGVENVAFLQPDPEQLPHFVLFMRGDAMREYNATGELSR